jgi:4-diphosphocytidyl-2-C-methyl-D-erythritol kinase
VFVADAPAKLNLSLAITGRRDDGFHELVSLVAGVALADSLSFTPGPAFALTCDDPTVPADGTNLVLRAAEVYARHRPDCVRGAFRLAKRIPHGAGLGGGSSDAAAALRLLDQAAPTPLGPAELERLAAEVGSDCPYFVRGGLKVMRGRGEVLAALPPAASAALSGRRVLIIKPPFGVATPEAYAGLAKSGRYQSAAETEAKLAAWVASPAADPGELGNDLAVAVFAKHLALPTALAWLRDRHGLVFRLTGSGSACYALVPEGLDSSAIQATLTAAWGPSAWLADTRISV